MEKDRHLETIEALIQQVAGEADRARQSEAIRRYLDSLAAFHQYSFVNCMMIAFQRPDATRVASLRTWNKLGRRVKKGEKGIEIFVPITVKRVKKSVGEDGQVEETVYEDLIGWKTGHVFDIAQTEGEPPPEVEVSDQRTLEVHQRLVDMARSFGISVETAELKPGVYGYAVTRHEDKKIVLSMESGTATLIHELAHHLLGHTDPQNALDRQTAEIEADTVAAVVLRWLGQEIQANANYLALWGGDRQSVLKRMERIRQCAHTIIKGLCQDNES